jgi:WD40 repeat protein
VERCRSSSLAYYILLYSLFLSGFVAFSPDERLKAVHDLVTDCYSLYDNTNPTTPLISLTPAGNTRKIKGACFGEGGGTLVCGGDNGSVYLYDVSEHQELQRLEHPGEAL